MAKRWSGRTVSSAVASAAVAAWAQSFALAAPPTAGLGTALETAASLNLAQSESNRLSIFHDYGLSVIGTPRQRYARRGHRCAHPRRVRRHVGRCAAQ